MRLMSIPPDPARTYPENAHCNTAEECCPVWLAVPDAQNTSGRGALDKHPPDK